MQAHGPYRRRTGCTFLSGAPHAGLSVGQTASESIHRRVAKGRLGFDPEERREVGRCGQRPASGPQIERQPLHLLARNAALFRHPGDKQGEGVGIQR